MRRIIILIATAASAVFISSSALAAETHHVIASCHARGTAASCTATGTIHHPRVIRAHATARPNQKVTVHWSMTCTKRKATRSTHGSFTARTPVSHRLHKPFRRPDACKVTDTTTLAKKGHLHAFLTAQS